MVIYSDDRSGGCPVTPEAHLAVIVREMLAAERQKLASLAPYNGTVPGARAISESRARVEALEENLAWRAAVNAPDQED